MRALRIVQLLPSLAWGGAERLGCAVDRLAREHGHHTCLDAPSLDALRSGISREIGTGPVDRGDRERTLRGWARGASRRIAAFAPDLVHAHLPSPDRLGLVARIAGARPLVVTFQLLPEPGWWPRDAWLRLRSDHLVRALATVRPRTAFVAVSRTDEARLAKLVPSSRLHTITNVPPPPRALAETVTLSWPQGVVRLLSIGRLHEQKGFDTLVPGLSHPAVRALPWHWTIVGDGPARAALVDLVARAGLVERVRFAGAFPADSLYAQCDLVLSPSRSEGMPLVPMEAIEAGVPVLASDIAPHRELLGDAHRGLLSDAVDGRASVLANLITDAPARASLAARQRPCISADPRGDWWRAHEALYARLLA